MLKENVIILRELLIRVEKELVLTCVSKKLDHHTYCLEKHLETLLKNKKFLSHHLKMLKNGISSILTIMMIMMNQLEPLNSEMEINK